MEVKEENNKTSRSLLHAKHQTNNLAKQLINHYNMPSCKKKKYNNPDPSLYAEFHNSKNGMPYKKASL